MAELADIMAEIVKVIEADLVPPSNQSMPAVIDYPPAGLATFPTIVVLERGLEFDLETSAGGKEDFPVWTVDVALLIGNMDAVTAWPDMRAWVKNLVELFNTRHDLNGVVDTVNVRDIGFAPFEWNESRYIALTLTLQVFSTS